MIVISIVIVLIALNIYFFVIKKKGKKSRILDEIKSKLLPLHPSVSKMKFLESTSSTYTEDKSNIFVCLTDSKGNYHSYNMLVYACIHEIAHCLTKSIGHTSEFYDNFNYLLKRAQNLGIYNPYQKLAKEYCGVKIPEESRYHIPS